MNKKIIILLTFLITTFSAYAQKVINPPHKGSFTVSLLLGRGHFLNQGLDFQNKSTNFTVDGAAPYVSSVDENDNSAQNMVGLEGKYFVTNNLAVSLKGGAILRHTPSVVNIPAVNGAGNAVVLPAYSSVKGEDKTSVHIEPGAEWRFNFKSSRLKPYVGLSLPFDYARHTVLDPTVVVENGLVKELSYGPAVSDLFGMGIQGNAGLDYFLTREMFIGFDVNPFSVEYVFSNSKPQPGALDREAQNITYSFFGRFSFKLGFVLN